MMNYGINREFIENHRVLFDPYMHKASCERCKPKIHTRERNRSFQVHAVCLGTLTVSKPD